MALMANAGEIWYKTQPSRSCPVDDPFISGEPTTAETAGVNVIPPLFVMPITLKPNDNSKGNPTVALRPASA